MIIWMGNYSCAMFSVVIQSWQVRTVSAWSYQRACISWTLQPLTFHAYQQQVGSEGSPIVLLLLHVEPLPIKLKEVHDNCLSHSVVESLLQVHSGDSEMFPSSVVLRIHSSLKLLRHSINLLRLLIFLGPHILFKPNRLSRNASHIYDKNLSIFLGNCSILPRLKRFLGHFLLCFRM